MLASFDCMLELWSARDRLKRDSHSNTRQIRWRRRQKTIPETNNCCMINRRDKMRWFDAAMDDWQWHKNGNFSAEKFQLFRETRKKYANFLERSSKMLITSSVLLLLGYHLINLCSCFFPAECWIVVYLKIFFYFRFTCPKIYENGRDETELFMMLQRKTSQQEDEYREKYATKNG